jgi:hypothetical protein
MSHSVEEIGRGHKNRSFDSIRITILDLQTTEDKVNETKNVEYD